MVKLSVLKINGLARTAFDQLFDEQHIDKARADGSDTTFQYKGIEYTVDDTFAELQALLDLPLSSRRTIWGKLDATADLAAGAHNFVDPDTGEDIELPINAIVIDGFYKVTTTCTSASDAATISLDIVSDDVAGLKAAIAISNGANPWDAGNGALIQTGAVANFSEKTTATRKISATVAVETVTAGVIYIFLDYVILP